MSIAQASHLPTISCPQLHLGRRRSIAIHIAPGRFRSVSGKYTHLGLPMYFPLFSFFLSFVSMNLVVAF